MSAATLKNYRNTNSKQRWEILTANLQNKENKTVNRIPTVQKPIKKYTTIIKIDKKQPKPQRTITSYFKIAQYKKYPNIQFLDEKGIKIEFQCFDDRSLGVPDNVRHTIYHNQDNDCDTDQEQIDAAIKSLQRGLEISCRDEQNNR